MIQLREYQQCAVDQIRSAYAGGFRAPLLVSPCASGKTIVFAHVAQGAQAKGNRVIILAHRQELLRQIGAALSQFSVPHGFIVAGRRPEPWHHTQVASVQSLVRRMGKIKAPDLIICDEAHHAVAGTYRKIFAMWPSARILGVTATPSRLDGSGLREIFDTMVIGPTVQELIDQQFLSPPVYYAPAHGPDVSKVHIVAGDFRRDELDAAIDRPTITGNAVEHYTRLCAGVPAIVFCASIKHAEHVTAEFKSAGYRAEMIDGKLDDKSRAARTEGLATGRVQVLVSVDVISEGYDVPTVTAAILLRPTASLNVFIQQVGRALRLAPGKQNAIILDHSGNTLRHGLIEESRGWSLDSKPRRSRKSEPTIRCVQCPKCFRVCAPVPVCPGCGHVFEVKSRQIDEVDGKLEQITAASIAARQARREIGMATGREALMAIARRRGYAPGWVHYILAARRKNRAHTPISETETIKTMKGDPPGASLDEIAALPGLTP